MTWYNNLKFASVEYMYHGTGMQNLSPILSEGLVPGRSLTYDEPLDYSSIRSYGGIYLTKNIMTAYSSGTRNIEKGKSEKSKRVIVMVKIETKTPHIVIDEDLFMSPGFSIQKKMPVSLNVSNSYDYLAYFITEEMNSKIDDLVDGYIESLKDVLNVSDDRILINLRPLVSELIRAYLWRQLAYNMNTYFQYMHPYQKEEFFEKYPQFRDINVGEWEAKYRSVADNIMRKVHRLKETIEERYSYNLRSLEPISFRGKNKIVLISVLKQNDIENEYYFESDILYMGDEQAAQKMISDLTSRLSSNGRITYKNNVLYEKEREFAARELV